MQSELKRLQGETGIAFVLVTHDQEEALAMSDRIAVMSGGNVLQVGAPRDIYDNPQSRFVADFIGESNLLSGSELGRSDRHHRRGAAGEREARRIGRRQGPGHGRGDHLPRARHGL